MSADTWVGWALIVVVGLWAAVWVFLNWQYDRWQRNNPRCDACTQVAVDREHAGADR